MFCLRFTGLATVLVLVALARPALAESPADEFQKNEQIEIVDAVAMLFETRFYDVECGKQMAEALRSAYQDGELTTNTSRIDFTKSMERVLHSVREDRHVHIDFQVASPRAFQSVNGKGIVRQKISKPRSFESGFGGVRFLKGGIGYIDFNQFLETATEAQVREGALQFVSQTSAIILDLRQNPGGSARTAEAMMESFLGAEPIHYATAYQREKTHEKWTSPDEHSVRVDHIPMYILVDRQTGSAAEAVAYHLKHLGRATIVGESTAGAGHQSRVIGLEVIEDETEQVVGTYQVMVPHTRSVNTVSGDNWELKGVQPDLDCPGDEALAVAHMTAIQKVAGDLPETKRLLEQVKASYFPPSVSNAELQRLAGRYEGDRHFVVQDGKLQTREGSGPWLHLSPLSETRFQYDSGISVLIEFIMDGNDRVVAMEFQYPDGGSDRRNRIE